MLLGLLLLMFYEAVTTHPHSHSHPENMVHPHADPDEDSASNLRIRRLAMFLEAHFGEVELHMPDEAAEPEQGEEESHEPSLHVMLDDTMARIGLTSMVGT